MTNPHCDLNLRDLHRQGMRLYDKAEAMFMDEAWPDLGGLHDEAMLAYGDAEAMAQRAGGAREDEIRALYMAALEKEREAAMYLLDKPCKEPSRAIFFKGAAVIAFKAGEYEEAERLLYLGLSGTPPTGFADEMRELLWELLARRRAAMGRRG